jgi:hypothetical protein
MIAFTRLAGFFSGSDLRLAIVRLDLAGRDPSETPDSLRSYRVSDFRAKEILYKNLPRAGDEVLIFGTISAEVKNRM